MKRKSKALAGLLSISMLMPSALPATALAAADDGGEKTASDMVVLADFNFDSMSDNRFDGGNAYAAIVGDNVSLEEHTDNGSAVRLGSSSYLDLKAVDGGSLLTGWDDVTISFDLKPTSNQSWVLYAAPDDTSLNWNTHGNHEQYLGFLVKSGNMEIERYHNNGSRPSKDTCSFTIDEWNHVEAEFTASGTVIRLNGAEVSSCDSAYLLSDIMEDTGIFQIGKANWGSGEYSDMALDNLRITASLGESVNADTDMKLTVGKSRDLKISGISQYADAEISFQSDNEEIAAVDEAGKVTAIKEGTAVITTEVSYKTAVKTLQTSVVVSPKEEARVIASLNFDGESIGDAAALVKGFSDYTGSITYEDGRLGKAVRLDGYGLRLNRKNVGESYTVSMWMKHDGVLKENQQILLLGRGYAQDSSTVENWLNIAGDRGSSNTYEIWTRNISDAPTISGWNYLDEDAQQIIGEWAMLTVTGDGTEFHAYLNGQPLELNGGGSTEAAIRNAANVLNGEEQDIYVGVNYWDTPFSGLVDDVVVYDQDLSAAEVQNMYEQQYLEYVAEHFSLGDLTEISENLTLPESQKDVQIAWVSENPDVLADDGTITRQENDTKVILKGFFTYGNAKLEKEYEVTVKHVDVTGDLEEAYSALTLCAVTGEDLNLPAEGKKNTVITWTSSMPDVLTNEGKLLARPKAGAGNTKVTLTAEISKSGESVSKSFEVEVLEEYYGYIYGYITGDNDRTGSLHLAYSTDGKIYTALNSNAGIHFARINPEDGTKNLSTGIRYTEISLFRKADGTFGLAAPQAKDQKQVYLYDSEDLLTYTNERLLSANSSVGNVSDVTVKYDASLDGYYLYWTSGGRQYANVTADFTSLEAAAEAEYTVPEISAESAPEGAQNGSIIGVTKAEYEKIMNHFAMAEYAGTEPVEAVTVETAADVKEALPDTVSVTYDDGSASAMSVKWDVDTPDFSKAGTYEVTGTVSSYENPLIEERADPQILYDEDAGCYYFTASYPAYGNVDRGYDRIVLRKADTIGGLLDDGTEITIWKAPDSGQMAKHVWAPELHKIDGKWYVFFAAGNSDNIWAIRPYVLVCQGNDPYDAANWVKADGTAEIHAAASEDSGCFDAMSLDMTYFTNEDAEGTVHHYVIWAELSPSSLYMQEVDPKQPWVGTGDVICLTAPEYGWERDSERVNEGPAILKHDGKIFCTFSASGTGPEYCIGLLYADETSDLMEPDSWNKLTYPVLTSDDVPGEYGPGHNSFTVDTDGNPVFVYHARSEECYQNQCAYANSDPLYDPCRHARVKNVHWSRDGLPILNMGAEEELPEAAKTVTVRVTVNQDTEVKRDLSEAVISGIKDVVATGEQICPDITVTWGTAALTADVDYTVAYGENRSGKGSVTITAAEGSRYTGTKTVEFKILSSLIAEFSFDSLTDGLRGGNAVAEIAGGSIELVAHEEGYAAKFAAGDKDYLNVTAADGSSLLSGYDEITVSYDILPDSSGTHWMFYAAPDDTMLSWNTNGNNERYLGVLVKDGTTEIERYNNNGSRPEKPTIAMEASRWQHVDIVYTKDCTVAYLDGKRVSKADSSYQLTDILGTDSIFQIGKANWNSGEYATMQLDNFRIVAGTKLYEEDKMSQAAAEIEEKLGDIRNVTENLELLTESSDGLTIEWSTDNADVIAADGKVTMPDDGNATVTLTAVITDGAEQVTKNYTVTVLAQGNVVNKLAEQLTLPYSTEEGREVYGNITLPDTAGGMSSITWEADHPEIVNVNETAGSDGYDAVPAGTVTRPEEDTDVTLTATVTLNGTSARKDFTFTVKAAPEELTEDDYTDYFFAYFTGERYSDGEQIYFSVSHDGLNWKELNDNNPVLTSTLGEKGVRDPFILRSPEGDKFYLIATDLKINGGNGWTAAQQAGSQALMIWESTDLVNWSEQRMVTVSADIEAGCTWAPEATYDERTGEYVVYWASKVAGDGYTKQRLYYAKTRDFYSFTEPQVYIEKDQSSIDTTMIENNGTYYRYTKNEGDVTNELGAQTKTIFIEKSSDVLGDFTQITSDTLNSRNNQYVEGPTIFKFNKDDADTDTWCLLVDDFGGGGYYPLITTDLESGEFTRLTNGYQLPGGTRFPRHGTPVRITAKEFAAVAKAYNMDTITTDELIESIDSLEVDSTNTAALKELLDTYNTLSDEDKALVTEERYEKLKEAVALAEMLRKDGVVIEDKSAGGYDFDFREQFHAVYVDSDTDGRYMKGYGSVSGDGAQTTFDNLFGGTQPFTVEMVVNPNGYGEGGDDYNLLFSKGDDCATLRVSEHKLYFHIKDSNGWQNITVPLTDEQMSSWIHVAAVYDGSKITAYVDGQTASAAAGALLASDYSFGIGYCEQKARYGKAGIRSLHVYNTALNAAQLDEGDFAATDDNVVLWYDFDTYSYGVKATAVRARTESLTLQINETVQAEAALVPYYADGEIHFQSLDETVAEVTENGIVTGTGDGNTVIRAFASDQPEVYVDIPVTVTDPDKAVEEERQKLQDRIEELGSKIEEGTAYTEESYQAYELALKEANDILAKSDATVQEIQEAIGKLNLAFEGLKKLQKPDTGALQSALESARAKDLSGYTTESAEAFRKALAEAAKVLENADASQAEIDAALKALRTAEAGLVTKPVENSQPGDAVKTVPAKGKTYDVAGVLRYKVTKSDAVNGTVSVTKLLKKNTKKVVIPASVVLDGYTFKVTAISAKAFRKSGRLKTVVIGSNVKSIGKRAFYQCKKLKNITFRSRKAPKIGKRAFKGIPLKCRITVPKKMTKKQFAVLKKRMKKAGTGSKAVYKKK